MFLIGRRKYIHVLTLVSLLLVAFKLIPRPFDISEDRPNLIDQLSMSLWSSRIKLEIVGSNSAFYKRITDLLDQKRKTSPENVFWAVDTSLNAGESELRVPPYFLEPVEKRPKVVPFDPRFTLAIYYHHLSSNADAFKNPVPFHWSDWVDFSVIDEYLLKANPADVTCEILDERPYQEMLVKNDLLEHVSYLKQGAVNPEEFCQVVPAQENDGLGILVKKTVGRMRPEKVDLAGKLHLYSQAVNPTSIIFLTKEGSYTVEVAPEKSKLLHNNLVDEYLKDSKKDTSINTLKEFKRLKKAVKPLVEHVVNAYKIDLKQEDFEFNDIQLLQDLETRQKSGSLSKPESNYLESLRLAVNVKKNPPKYFYEAKVFDSLYGDHYDVRFFNGFRLNSLEQASVLHRLLRVWLSFARKQGITTWVAHGSLLAWYWNGIGFPWDSDIDVQVPVMDLHKLSMLFNQSLIVEDGENGFGRYFLDCGTFIATRDHNNGNNNIDARFIDVDTGLYIDITGLAVSNDQAPERYKTMLPQSFDESGLSNSDLNKQLHVFNCRNHHFVSLSEVSPLVKSFVESEVAYIPLHFSDILTYEYKDTGITNRFFKGWFFLPQLRLWVHQDILRQFIRHRNMWNSKYVDDERNPLLEFPRERTSLNMGERKALTMLSEDDLVALLHHDELLIDYMRSRDLTSTHENEIMRFLFRKSTEDVVNHAPELNPLMYEPFLYHLNLELITFDARVERYIRLNEKYEEEVKKLQEESNGGTDQ